MATSFRIPKSPEVQIYQNDTFLGADFTTDVGNVDDTKSPDVVNMIRSIPGKIRKRMGYKQVCDMTVGNTKQPVYGVYYFSYANAWIVHAKDKLYQFRGGTETYWHEQTPKKMQTEDLYNILFANGNIERVSDMNYLCNGMAERRSTAYELNQLLLVLDGNRVMYVAYDKSTHTLSAGRLDAYPKRTIPLVRFSCSPDGAGVDYQPFNLLNTQFEQDYLITQNNVTTLQLFTDRIASASVFPVTLKYLQANGTWTTITEGSGIFAVDRTAGQIKYGTHRVTYPITSITDAECTGGYNGNDETYYFTLTTQIVDQVKVYMEASPSSPDSIDWLSMRLTVHSSLGSFMGSYSLQTEIERSGSKFYVTADFSSSLIRTENYYAPKTPIAGVDNIKVQAAYIPLGSTTDLINHCRFGVLYGVNGASDRLFVSGNEDSGTDYDEHGNVTGTYSLRNRDWFSDQNDPTYFPDVGYSVVGVETSAIMGYVVVGAYLATVKDSNEMSQTVFIREGTMVTYELGGTEEEGTMPAFKLVNSLQGAGAISNFCFDYMETEPIFLSKRGIYSLTSQDITGEKYAQNRSYYLNGKLLKENNLNDAIGFIYKDYYVLCVNNHFYILDGLQPLRTDKAAPYATRQYASFYFEFNLNPGEMISYIWEMYGRFYFGTTHGRIMRFYWDEKDLQSYSDNGNAIAAKWQTPDIAGRLFYKNKTFRYVALKVNPARNSSILIEGEKNGVWDVIKEEYAKTKYFSFIDFTFARTPNNHPMFTFMCDKTQKVVTTKTRIKKIDKVQFRFSNSEVNEPLGLNNFALEYTQGGNIK